ncbi:MAG TPA: lysylphosphatidylglycerol synthase domain-containing protein, partial [Nannocystaceae bacterium]|nr:lysylphosphatidylglycerol synthase domain-containing protein [Nannocystaceae bacterium]
LIACVGALAGGLPLLAGAAAAAFVIAWLAILAVVRWRRAVASLPGLRRRRERVEQLLFGLHALVQHPRWLLAACALSLAAWSMSLGLAQVMFAMTDAGVDPRTTLALFPLAVLTSTVPVTIAGMGTRDAAFIYLLRVTGSGGDEPAVLVATIAYAIVGTWSLAVIGVPFMIALVLRIARARTHRNAAARARD